MRKLCAKKRFSKNDDTTSFILAAQLNCYYIASILRFIFRYCDSNLIKKKYYFSLFYQFSLCPFLPPPKNIFFAESTNQLSILFSILKRKVRHKLLVYKKMQEYYMGGIKMQQSAKWNATAWNSIDTTY